MPRSMTGRGRHVSYNAEGELCMTVVDPVTRKLLIPTQYIFDTRAQQRGTLPSLCQLFLSGRCRQGQGCYQVHADWEAVQRLRAQVDSLPCCCPDHGDKDHLGVMDNAPLRDVLGSGVTATATHNHTARNSAAATATDATATATVTATESNVCARDVVVYVPGCSTYEGSYVPLERISYTVGLRRLLEDQHVLLASPSAHVSLLNPETGFPEDKVVADASGATVCRLHAMDRCRYAEECKFLHLCKELTSADPQLTATPAATTADCATNAPECSFDASVTSTGMSGTTAMGASASSIERRGKNAHSASASATRQSVFTSISMQQQQQQQHSSLNAVMSSGGGSSSGFAGLRPLLVPQREEANAAATAAMTAAQIGTAVPFLSKSLPSYHVATNIASGPLLTATQPAEVYMGPNVPMAASVGSFPGNHSCTSPTAMTNAYAPANGRIRVSLSLPAVSSFSNVNNAAGLGTSNSSEKNSTPADDTLAAMGGCSAGVLGGGVNAGSLGNSGLIRSMPLSYGASSNPARWHHNPYGSSLSKCEVPNAGSCSSFSHVNGHPNSNVFTAMTR